MGKLILFGKRFATGGTVYILTAC